MPRDAVSRTAHVGTVGTKAAHLETLSGGYFRETVFIGANQARDLSICDTRFAVTRRHDT